jgi:hypothetical protein
VTSFTNAFSSRFTLHGAAGPRIEISDAESVRLVARAALPAGRGGYVDQNLAEWRQGGATPDTSGRATWKSWSPSPGPSARACPRAQASMTAPAALRICEAILESVTTGRSVALA